MLPFRVREFQDVVDMTRGSQFPLKELYLKAWFK